jgi:CRP/FNR family transcriptional regulator, cyclic AMP receptor protein
MSVEVTPIVPPPRDAKALLRTVDKLAPLRNHPLFREFPPAVIEQFGTYMTRRAVLRGATIFAKEDAGTGLMAVLWGSVKISVPTPDGREAVLNIVNPGEIFGEIALLDGRPRTADAIAMTDCELMVIDRRGFIPFLRGQPDIALKFIEILCGRIRRTSEQVEDVMYLSFPGRLAKTLLQLTGGAGPHAAQRNVRITQRELSSIIGTSRESTNKQLRAWERRKWVRLERGGIVVLNADALVNEATEGLGAVLS